MFRIILIGLLVVSIKLQAFHRYMNLQKAVDTKNVEVCITSLGIYKGRCIQMILKNRTQESLIILVEPGRRLNSVDDKNQDILIVQEELIVLSKREEKNFTVKGYCCQASNRCPYKGARFSVNKMAEINLVKIARFLNTHAFEDELEQNAVWSISDDRPATTVTSMKDTLGNELREMVASIKGEKLPWYTLYSKKYQYSGGTISVIPILLRGQLIYSNDKENYVTLTVKNQQGKEVCQLKSEWMKADALGKYRVELPITNLAKGKYSIELKTTEKSLAKEEFEI
jgi:hypothetical protein